MANLKQSTAYTRTFLMVDSSDHLSPKTGLTVGVWLSKAGAAFTAVSGSVSELSFGWYKVALNTTDTNTLGELAFHCTGSAADLTDFVDQVTGNILGDTLPANVTQWAGVAPNALISGTVDGFQHYPVIQNANVAQWLGVAPNALISGTVDAFSHYANPVGIITGTFIDAIADGVWDEVLTGATHNVPASAGRRLRTIPQTVLDAGTAQAGGPDSITLAATASTTEGLYVGGLVIIDGGTGAGQARYIVGYTAARVASVARHWTIAPDITSTYTIVGDNQVLFISMGLAQGGGANTITLQSNASAIDNIYNGQLIRITSGTGDDQIRLITAYNGTTKVATIEPSWTVQPDNTSYYGTLQAGITTATQLEANALADIRTGVGLASANLDTQIAAIQSDTDNIQTRLPAALTGNGNIKADMEEWRTAVPNNLISGTVDAFSHYANPTQAFLTGTVDVNLTQWRGTQPNILISGTVDSFEHYGNPIQSYHTGTVDANLIQIDGAATNGNNATLNLKQLNINNPSGDGVSIIGSDDGIFISAPGNGLNIQGGWGAYITGNDFGVFVDVTNGDAVRLQGEGVSGSALSLFALGASGKSINAPQSIVGDIIGNITGSITGNIYGDIYGRVGWVTGSVQQVLLPVPVSITGTVNANLVQWEGIAPNALISGTVDSFTHYTNYPSSTITGSVDANVIAWRGNQPNDLISGTVDAYAHYISTDAVTSIWSNATRTLTSFGTLIADIWAAVVDSSGVTTLLSRLTAGRATNLDNLDEAISNVPTANENADAFLKRDWTAVTGEASRSVLNALRFIRNKFSTTAHANKVTIYKEDDTTEAYQKDVTTDATADPIVEG